MTKKELIEDSIEFCHDIRTYYKENTPGSLERHKYESIKKETDESIYYDRTIATEKYHNPYFDFAKGILSLVLCVALAFMVALCITTYVGQHTKVDGHSMEDTLSDGDLLIIDKLAYRFNPPERYDIIVFKHKSKINYIKRIIALPGDTVQIKEGEVYINAKPLKEEYGKEIMENPGLAKDLLVVGKDEYFVLGDNRNDSCDSRFESVGMVKKDKIVGRAWLRVFPFNKMGILKHQ